MMPFELGWDEAIRLWRAGVTWESISHVAEREWQLGAHEFSRGMTAGVNVMSGWIDMARREAKAFDFDAESLISRTRAA